jgi:hypothetical protein
MKKLSIFFLIIPLLSLASVSLGGDASKEGDKPPPASSPEFDKIKSLAGSWEGEGEMNGKKEKVRVDYKVTSAGTAVEETLFPGTTHEMVSLYTVDDGKILMTHYCALGNQPRMKMTKVIKDKKGEKIQLAMVDATGMKSPQDPHMAGLTLVFKGKNNMVHEWVFKGPEGDKVSVFEYKRKS